MSMNTPIGNITQTTPIKDFKELDEMQNEQYLLGIDDNTVGNGSKISLENLINSSISADSDNLITKGTDDRLLVNTPVEIGDLSNLTTTNKSTLVAAINEVDSDLATEVTNRVNAVSGEATARQNADNNLQSQIDAITAASDVTDIVGTYAELQAYDTTGLSDKSVIKVLQDESRQNETTYYRWVITGGVGAWVLVGEEGPYYTISQADSKFATKATVGDLNNLATSDKSSIVNAMNELASVLDPTQTVDYIKNSKAIYSGEVSENALILPQIKEMAHSTFDRSKFTVVGSPNITDDGIASGLSLSNYIKISKSINTLNFKLYLPFKAPATQTNNVLIYRGEKSNSFRFQASRNTSGDIIFNISDDNSSIQTGGFTVIPNSDVVTNDNYILIITQTNTQMASGYYHNGVYTPSTIIDDTRQLDVDNIYIASNKGQYTYTVQEIDLKQFSIKVDEVEVFNGNKTGIDTVKPDNYTVVGTPTISANGILDKNVYATQQDALGNYLSHYIGDIPTTSTIRVKCKFTVKKLQGAIGGAGGVYGLRSPNTPTGGICIPLIENNSTSLSIWGEITGGILSFYNCTIGSTYYLETIDTYTRKTVNLYDVNDNLLKTGTYNKNSATSTNWEGVEFYISQSSTTQQGNNSCSFDLNEFKVWIDGNLVYQPCLKIPYTESKTGSKIVQSTYRNRVKDMYEQFGYAPYYTLSDTDFTLPQGEVYGYLEKRARDIAHPVAQPFYRFSDEINEDEVRLEGAEVDKGLYLAIEQDPYLSALCTAGSTADKICLPDFRNRVIYGDVASGYVEPELPNITGNISVQWGFDYSAVGDGGSGALYNNYSAQNQNGINWNSSTTNSADSNIRLDASRSSSIYKDNGTVKTAGVKARWLCRWK